MAYQATDAAKKQQDKNKRHIDARTIKLILQAFSPYKAQIFLAVISILGTTLLGLVSPFVIRVIFDSAIPHHDLRLLFISSLVLIIIPIVIGVITVGQTHLSSVVGQRVIRDFRNRLYVHLQAMSFHFFTSMRIGEIQSRLFNDVNGVQGVITDTATRIVSNLSIVISTIIVMIYLSPLLTLITLGLLPFFIWLTYKVGNAGRRTQKETQQSMASLSTLMQETLSVSGILLIKSFGSQKSVQEKFAQENQKLSELGVHLQMIANWFSALINIIFSITPAAVYFMGGWQMIAGTNQGGITLGSIIAFTTLQARLLPAIGQILNVQILLQSALALFERIFEYLDLPIEIEDGPHPICLEHEAVRGTITFEDVVFSYKREEPIVPQAVLKQQDNNSEMADPTREMREQTFPPTLDHISFNIKSGQLVALVGPSGAGKTTITYLLPRFYDVNSGAVKIDGHNVKDISLASLSSLVGVVTQETYLFHASIKENLLFASPDATEEEMVAATQAAAIHDRIMRLDNGYDTIVGERGYKLSGGEKQRIAIARVILKNPRIFILDEATSALDTHSERLVQSALEPLMKNRTTIAIAHRLSTVLSADVILVIDKGRIVEQGIHQDLLKKGETYAKLYNQQFQQQALEIHNL